MVGVRLVRGVGWVGECLGEGFEGSGMGFEEVVDGIGDVEVREGWPSWSSMATVGLGDGCLEGVGAVADVVAVRRWLHGAFPI